MNGFNLKQKLKVLPALFAALAAVVALLALPVNSAHAAKSEGKIICTKVSGDVTFTTADGEEDDLAPNTEFAEDTDITTGANGTASIWFANGAHVVIKPNTKIQISKFQMTTPGGAQPDPSKFKTLSSEPGSSTTQIRLDQGKIVIEVVKLNAPATDFKVTSAFLVATVKESSKGAVFTVEQQEEYAKLGCVRGIINLKPRLNLGKEVDVPEKKQVILYLRKKPATVEYYEYTQRDEIDRDLVEPPVIYPPHEDPWKPPFFPDVPIIVTPIPQEPTDLQPVTAAGNG
ncbi:MAG: FecR family protein [Puniceicoccales bacterium]|jgi:hypothetical protein|nr:FecR family protein [Puniceicoccales bacterium]